LNLDRGNVPYVENCVKRKVDCTSIGIESIEIMCEPIRGMMSVGETGVKAAAVTVDLPCSALVFVFTIKLLLLYFSEGGWSLL